MKKTLSFILALALLCSCASTLAAGYDMTYIRENSNAFTIDVNEDSEVAFVESTLSAKERSFVHRYESDHRYSSTMFDVLVINYEKSSAYPVPRLWITYCADEYIYYDSVTFTLNGKDYTFSGISDPDWRSKDEKGVVEEALIKFGTEAVDFLFALKNYREKFASYDELMNETKGPKIKMVLHGRSEDITVTLGGGFLLDFTYIIEGAYMETGGLDYIENVISTTMSVSDGVTSSDGTERKVAFETLIPVKATATPVPTVSVSNGKMFIRSDYEGVCTLKVNAGSESDYYVYLKYIGAPSSSYDKRKLKVSATAPYESDLAFYVKAGKTVSIKVPIGIYTLFYATGTEFYGTALLFGDSTPCFTSDSPLTFYTSEDGEYIYSHGHEVTLYKVAGGNFDTDPIPESSFP
ncbi:MAG: hypothetical protein IKI84_02090, partial [Clostridia bacterium]|nr:hypothetical protein [Clostridia bacterium]